MTVVQTPLWRRGADTATARRRQGSAALRRTVRHRSVGTAPPVDREPVPERTVLIVHPSPDLYGADLQMLQSARGLVGAGWNVVVVLPEDGELVPRLRELGVTVRFLPFPVLRKSQLRPRALLRLLRDGLTAVARGRRLIRSCGATAVLVNTITLPWWLLAARLARVATVAHLHEAETGGRALVRRLLIAPLFLAEAVIVISVAARASITDLYPSLAERSHLIYNGVPQPTAAPSAPSAPVGRTPYRLATVGRLSPRKAPHVALEATAELVARGHDVTLEVAGTCFAGYEWYEDQLRARAQEADLAGRVTFSGYQSPVWPVFARADIVLAPSLQEPFGNAVVEAQLSERPVVAAAAQGHLESVEDGRTGLLVAPGDAQAMADAVSRLLGDEALTARLSRDAASEARRRFSVERYHHEIASLVGSVAGSRESGARAASPAPMSPQSASHHSAAVPAELL